VQLASDPSADFGLFHSRHATSETNPGDRNVGGFSDAAADELIDRAAVATDHATRAALYEQLAARLSLLVPVVPIWYESSWSAVSGTVVGPNGEPVDPAASRYAWNAPTWRVEAP
jgi:ABC-type transport system substrate-binding protein